MIGMETAAHPIAHPAVNLAEMIAMATDLVDENCIVEFVRASLRRTRAAHIDNGHHASVSYVDRQLAMLAC